MNTITIKMNNAKVVAPKSDKPWYERAYMAVSTSLDEVGEAIDRVNEARERHAAAWESTAAERRAKMVKEVSRNVEATFKEMGFDIKFEDESLDVPVDEPSYLDLID